MISENSKREATILFLGIALSTLLSSFLSIVVIFPLATYYESSDAKLNKIIQLCPYSPEEYQANIFDCSNMANMLDAWLEKEGYESWLVVWNTIDGSSGHVVLLVNGRLVEPTTKMLRGTLMDLVQEGKYSNQPLIIDNPTQLSVYIENEWNYPKRW